MPFDEGNRCWKIRILNREGISRGLLVIASSVYMRGQGDKLIRYGERTWPGKPREKHYETLYQWKESDGELTYFVLIHFGHEFTENDYGQEVSRSDAALWLLKEGFNVPDDLKEYANTPLAAKSLVVERNPGFLPPPLTEALQEVWDALTNRFATAKELAKEILDDALKGDVIRKRIQAIRKTGRGIGHLASLGYFRPDAPPPELLNPPDRECA